MGKKPVIRKFDEPTDEQEKALEQSIEPLKRSAPVKAEKAARGGRPPKYGKPPVKRTVLVPADLDESLRARAEENAAGNVTAVVIRALEMYLER